jgi:chromosome segregation ATPase
VRNIGGIDETSVAFKPGVTVLAGRNATNRTSLLQGTMAALGSDDISVKADAEQAHVDLEIGGETYTRTIEVQKGQIRSDGNPYLVDSTLADLFAFLLESNEGRRAVVTDADLREIIMRPVDTDEIQVEIDRLIERRREISDELDDLKTRLSSLKKERTKLQDRIEKKKVLLSEVEADIEAANAEVEESRERQAELEEKLEELRDKRSTLEDVRYELETEQDSLESLRVEKREVENEADQLSETPAGDVDELESRITRLRSEKQELESELNELQSVIRFNEEMLEDDPDEALSILTGDKKRDTVTDELLADETVTCWTCGNEVAADQIEMTVEKLQDRSKEMVGKINHIDSKLEELKRTRRKRQKQQQRRERLDNRLHGIINDITDTEARIEMLTERRETLQDGIEQIESEVETLDSDAYEEILERHKEANQIEYDLGKLENDVERVEENIVTTEDRLDQESDLKSERDQVNKEIDELRNRIERIEQEAIEAFNENMGTVLDLLEYENLARIWLERTEQEVREGRQKVKKSVFNLHIVRQSDSGVAYEDVVDNLSESEREVTGLIFSLAGYLVHEVYDTVPFMLLDSLEAIDSDRIAALIDYLKEYSNFLVVALLPEDANALDERYQRVTNI